MQRIVFIIWYIYIYIYVHIDTFFLFFRRELSTVNGAAAHNCGPSRNAPKSEKRTFVPPRTSKYFPRSGFRPRRLEIAIENPTLAGLGQAADPGLGGFLAGGGAQFWISRLTQFRQSRILDRDLQATWHGARSTDELIVLVLSSPLFVLARTNIMSSLCLSSRAQIAANQPTRQPRQPIPDLVKKFLVKKFLVKKILVKKFPAFLYSRGQAL